MNIFALYEDSYWSFGVGEIEETYNPNNVLYKDIYLGIQTNIVCLDDRPKDYEGFKLECLHYKMPQMIMRVNDNYIPPENLSYITTHGNKMPPTINDVSATLYLGKITFAKNKKGNLAPIYIPSKITESSFEGLNTFWLNEINPNPIAKPEKFMSNEQDIKWMIDDSNTIIRFGVRESILESPLPYIDPEGYKYLKNFYFRSPKNIILTKEQIISYFTELHTLNATFIKNYIDSINKEEGIKANYLHYQVYNDLLQKGILQKDMFKWFDDKSYYAFPEAELLALDYLKKTNQYNFKILLFNKLFYYYLFLSLNKFVIMLPSGNFCEKNNLIFNAGAYKKYYDLVTETQTSLSRNPKTGKMENRERKIFNNTINGRNNGTLFFSNGVGLMSIVYSGDNFIFQSPNIVHRIDGLGTIDAVVVKAIPLTYTPSPLGNYYFELTDNKNTFIEFYQRIYPSINNPPKGWSKEMMSKLDLKLE